MWITRVVLVINLVVSTGKKWPRTNAIGIGLDEGKKKAARGLCSGNFRKKASLQLTRSIRPSHWPSGPESGSCSGSPQPPDRVWAPCPSCAVAVTLAAAVGGCYLAKWTGWKSGKIASVEVPEKPTVPGLTVQSCQTQKQTWGQHCCGLSSLFTPRPEGDTDNYMKSAVPNVHGCVAIAWFRRASGSKRGGRWEMTSVLCLYYRVGPAGRSRAQAGAPS